MTPILKPLLPSAERLLPWLQQIDESRWYSNYGPLVSKLEAQLSARWGGTHLTTVSNATVGLTLCLESMRLAKGSYCIVPTWTFAASPLAIYQAGLIPYFVDVDPITQTPSVDQIRAAVQQYPTQISSLMVVYPFGAPIEAEMWEKLADELGIALLFDAAAAFDTWTPTRAPSVISLHATKILGAGEGGVVLSSDVTLIEEVRSRTTFGFPQGERSSHFIGQNAKMSEYHAAVALASLESYQETRALLKELYRRYQAFLEEAQLSTQEGFGEAWLSLTLNIQAPSKEAVSQIEDLLTQHKIQTRRWWGLCHTFPAFKDAPTSGDFSHAEHLYNVTIGLPFYVDLDPNPICTVLKRVNGAQAVVHEPL